MRRTALVPIDNRPVCYILPKLISKLDADNQLYMPDISLIGNLTQPACINEILEWLEQLENIDKYIITLDTAAYGGLIPSRRCCESTSDIIKRIDKLAGILKKAKLKNKSEVYAFSSIMRISNNNENEEEKEYWNLYGRKIFQYSYNFHKKNETAADIPNYILEDYLNTRKRNFEVNKYYIELKKQGIIDTLVFSKDDCAEYGLNVMEAEELKRLSAGINEIFIKTGADEIPLTLISRALNKDKKIKIHPVYTRPDCVNKISHYEDISVKNSVNSQIELSGGIVSDEKESSMILLVNNFENVQGELVMNISTPLFSGVLPCFDKPFCAADIVNANGADNNFALELLKNIKTNTQNFYGYAGWNTSGNTLGSVLSAALSYFGAAKPDKTAFNTLQSIRFLDDYAYQANVRQMLRCDKSNLNSDILTKYMKKYEKEITDVFPVSGKIEYYFPWNRFFEIGAVPKNAV